MGTHVHSPGPVPSPRKTCPVALIVQKYGGSSVADASSIKRVAKRVAEAKRAGHDVVVVVSAMGDTTDELIDLAQQVTPLPPQREMDILLTAGERISMSLLAMAIHNLGVDAKSFTGQQAGVITDEALRQGADHRRHAQPHPADASRRGRSPSSPASRASTRRPTT